MIKGVKILMRIHNKKKKKVKVLKNPFRFSVADLTFKYSETGFALSDRECNENQEKMQSRLNQVCIFYSRQQNYSSTCYSTYGFSLV